MLRPIGALAAGIAAAAIASGCGHAPDAPVSAARADGGVVAQSTAPAVAPATPAPPAPKVPLRRAIGQRLVTGYYGAKPTITVLRAVHQGHVGGVILFKDNLPSLARTEATIKLLQEAAADGKQPPLLVMVDQEGGDVRRLPTLPPTQSPAAMGASSAPKKSAQAQGRSAGTALRKLGFNVDLAPVADVPNTTDSFLGDRAFSRKPTVVAAAACGFVDGLAESGIAGALKHFPGLGRARGNTDLAPVSIAGTSKALRTDLAAYKRCAPTAPMVMISSAAYPALGIDQPAVLDPRTYRLLAARGFAGITISDAFDTPSIAGRTRPALRAVRAGIDLLLYGQRGRGAAQAYSALVADAKAGSLDRDDLNADAGRIMEFKTRLASSTVR